MSNRLAIEDRSLEGLDAHPLSAEIFGQLSNEQFADLKADIHDNGLRYPLEIDIFGRVICGSQRLRAIKAIGWTSAPCIIRTDLQDEDTIRAWLIRDNTLRRQLTPGQMYRAGVELERIKIAQAKLRQTANLPNAKAPTEPLGDIGRATEQVANELGTSRSTYERVKKVFESDDEKLKEMVDQGLVSISAAARKVEQRPHETTKLAPNDDRALPLRFAKWQTAVERFQEWLEAHPPDFEHLQNKAHDSLVLLSTAVEKAIKQAK